MLPFSAVVFGFIAAFIIYIIFIYNGLVSLKHNTAKAWSNIDVLLKQRHNELPKLVEVCKQYMQFEQATLEQVIQARAGVASAREQGEIKTLGAAETRLRQGLNGLFALAEAYPDLQANHSFQQVQQRIITLENDIAFRREFYNESVNQNNIRIEQFPDVIIARLFAFKSFDLMKFTEEEIQDINITSLFNS
jgi:LemA protein